MATSELAGIVDILPPPTPSTGMGADYWLWLALLPLLWWLWRRWRQSGHWQWRIWRLQRRVQAQRLGTRGAADLLWRTYRQRWPDAIPAPEFKAAFDQARFAARPPAPSQLQWLFQQVRDAG